MYLVRWKHDSEFLAAQEVLENVRAALENRVRYLVDADKVEAFVA